MILPTAVFTAVELAVTFLHWDRFKLWTAPFNIWFASYVLPPPHLLRPLLVAAAPGPPGGRQDHGPPPGWFRTLCAANGLALLVVFAADPGRLRACWSAPGRGQSPPPRHEPLSGWGICLGLLLLSMAAENDWPRVRLGTLMPITLGPALLLQ